MSDRQEEGDRDLESDKETQEREDEIQQALILESRLTILQSFFREQKLIDISYGLD
jgi:hypothetical protein